MPEEVKIVTATGFAGGKSTSRREAAIIAAITEGQIVGQGNPDVIRANILAARDGVRLEEALRMAAIHAMQDADRIGMLDAGGKPRQGYEDLVRGIAEKALQAAKLNFYQDLAARDEGDKAVAEGVTDIEVIAARKNAARAKIA